MGEISSLTISLSGRLLSSSEQCCVLCNGIVFDADPGQTFHFDADPYPDPTRKSYTY
jgi:hypothetical protein